MAVTYYGVHAASNWHTLASWSTISAKDATRVGNAAVLPTTADTCYLDDYSGNFTVDTLTCTCGVLDCTGNGTYGGTLTNNFQLNVVGNITLSGSMTMTGTGILQQYGNSTLVTNGIKIPLYWPSTGTQTLTGALTVGTLLWSTSSLAFAGAYNITADTLNVYHNQNTTYAMKIPNGQTLTVNTAINALIPTNATITMQNTSSTTAVVLTYKGTVANCKVANMMFSYVDASSSSVPIYNWMGGTLTGTKGIVNLTSPRTGIMVI